MLPRVRLAYIIGVVLWVAGVGLAVVGTKTGHGGAYLCDNGTAFCGGSRINPGLLVAGLYVAWLSIAVLVAAYGRSKDRPFFPLLVAGWFIPFPVTLLAIAVTSTVDPSSRQEPEPESAVHTASHPLGPYFQ